MNHYRTLYRRLEEVYPTGEAQALARSVMEDVFQLTMTDLLLDKDNALSGHDLEKLENIASRLLREEPLQYILGEAMFCGKPFHVEPGVLIPRPETEELVNLILYEHKEEEEDIEGDKEDKGKIPSTDNEAGETSLSVLDIGTGSGCIAISLALARGDWKVEAWDISEEALRIARGNAKKLDAMVHFRRVDVLRTKAEDVVGESRMGMGKGMVKEKFDIVVSNPPYICQREASEMSHNVLDHEPGTALFVPDDDPLLFYRAIGELGLGIIRPGGSLYFEINRAYGKETAEMLDEMGYNDVEVMRDRYDNDRMIRARR